jgi:sodium/hydrogen exchanger 8
MAAGDVVGVAHSFLLKAKDLSDDADHMHVVSICLFVFLLCACIVLGHLLEENRWMNESITALLLVSTVHMYGRAICSWFAG